MTQRTYRLVEGSVQYEFAQSRAKIQIFGGGFGNGKTTALAIKALNVAKDYPGSNILLARSTYPKLNDTLRKVVLMWCPAPWIKKFSLTDNELHLNNGSVINFRYIQQRSNAESSTSNLLSATYDFIGVDQMEDPEITEKDYLDLLGRLRGNTVYDGDDPSMPVTGPRWFIMCVNPTRNWFYRKLIKPLHQYYETGVVHPDLALDKHTNKPIIELFEGSTYTNIDNLPVDFVETMETTYKGEMRERYLLGKWSAYEGLVYSEFDETRHLVHHDAIIRILRRLRLLGYDVKPVLGYDYGLAVPSCFLLGFTDNHRNVFFFEGFYAAELSLAEQAHLIKQQMSSNGFDPSKDFIRADPAIFRRGAGNQLVGRSIAEMFSDYGINMIRGNNDIINGIQKVKTYLVGSKFHKHPVSNVPSAPYVYFSDRLDFVANEFGDYYWKKDVGDETVDKPQDKNDHAMDTIKYALSDETDLPVFIGSENDPKPYEYWNEAPDVSGQNKRKPRYA